MINLKVLLTEVVLLLSSLLEFLTFIPGFVFKACTSIMSSDETSLKITHLDGNMDIKRLLI